MSLILGGAVALVLAAVAAWAGYDRLQAERPGSARDRMAAWTQADQKTGDPGEIIPVAQRALDRRPLDSEAARTMALVYEKTETLDKARSMMAAANGLNRRDFVVNLWQFGDAMQRRDYESAYTKADAILRVRSSFGENFYPYMLAGLNDPNALPHLAKALARKPEWRDAFMLFAMSNATHTDAPYKLLTAVKAAGSEPTSYEVTLLVGRLVSAGLIDQAYLNWILFMPQEQLSQLRTVYDGDFDGWPLTPPFTWNFAQGISGDIQNAGTFGRNEGALRIEYDGFSKPTFVRQLLFLTPGSYRLSGQALTASYDAPGKVEWVVTCAGGSPEPLARAPVSDTQRAWKPFLADFDVSPACRSQWLELRPLPGDRRTSVEVWYDEINVNPRNP